MKSVKKILAMCLAIMMIVSCVPAAHAADVSNTAIDLDAKGSLTLYKYDLTNAEKDGVWDSSYVSTGVYDENVNKTLGESKRAGDSDNSSDLGNGEVSYGYAVKGVEFTYLRVGDIIQYTGSANDGAADNHIEILYRLHLSDSFQFCKNLRIFVLAHPRHCFQRCNVGSEVHKICWQQTIIQKGVVKFSHTAPAFLHIIISYYMQNSKVLFRIICIYIFKICADIGSE